MHKQARLPEIFDQIAQNTPVLEFGSEHPPPRQIEIWTDLATLGFDFSEHPPQLKFGQCWILDGRLESIF